MTRYDETQKQEITDLLVGHTVTKVADNTLRLDDGTVLELEGHDGECSCSAGCYDLVELNGVDNFITRVEFEDEPSGDDYVDGGDGMGHYKIFVFAENRRINLATFKGTDGNGYYGTGYEIRVRPAEVTP